MPAVGLAVTWRGPECWVLVARHVCVSGLALSRFMYYDHCDLSPQRCSTRQWPASAGPGDIGRVVMGPERIEIAVTHRPARTVPVPLAVTNTALTGTVPVVPVLVFLTIHGHIPVGL